MPSKQWSPWGWFTKDDVEVLARGIRCISTSGHGGVKLSEGRNKKIPETFRLEGGWYEEDSDWVIPAMVFADEFATDAVKRGKDPERLKNLAIEIAKNDHPDFFTHITGIKLATEDSRVLRKRDFDILFHDRFIVTAAFGSWHKEVPKGKVGVIAKKPSTGEKRGFLVDEEEYQDRGNRGEFGFVIDLGREFFRHEPWNTELLQERCS